MIMNENGEKLVSFCEYCRNCVYAQTEPSEDPCCECVSHPVNLFSERPVFFKEKDK